MSAKVARTHTHLSNRAKAHQDVERKTVYKSVLENPFKINWPSVPINLQNQCLAMAVTMVEGLYDHRMSRKRKRSRVEDGAVAPSKRRKSGKADAETAATDTGVLAQSVPNAPITEMAVDSPAPPPPILQHLTTGINQVTRKLEVQIQASRPPAIVISTTNSAPEPEIVPGSTPQIKIVFVCRADIDPPILIDHIPHLVATYNAAVKLGDVIKLVPLPKGAEVTLAQAMGLRRVAVLAVDNAAEQLSLFQSLLPSISTLTAPWLVPITNPAPQGPRLQPKLVPTHIKQLRTTAPKDMKAAKERRANGRAAAKLKQRQKRSKATLLLKAGNPEASTASDGQTLAPPSA